MKILKYVNNSWHRTRLNIHILCIFPSCFRAQMRNCLESCENRYPSKYLSKDTIDSRFTYGHVRTDLRCNNMIDGYVRTDLRSKWPVLSPWRNANGRKRGFAKKIVAPLKIQGLLIFNRCMHFPRRSKQYEYHGI